jgi:hypothetical protein
MPSCRNAAATIAAAPVFHSSLFSTSYEFAIHQFKDRFLASVPAPQQLFERNRLYCCPTGSRNR